MIRGARILVAGSYLLAAGCAATRDVQVRPIADPAAKFRYSGGLLAEARGQLALGNVGLALETFRKLQRDQPESADAFAGIAACYSAMGRYDIARANYEFALAYAPDDPMLLYALASTLERLGESEQAAQVRGEASRLAARAGKVKSTQAAGTPIGVPRRSSITVKVPAAVAAPEPANAQIVRHQPMAVGANVQSPSRTIIKMPAWEADVKVSIATNEEPSKIAVAPSPTIARPQLSSAAVDLPSVRLAASPARVLPMSAEILLSPAGAAPSPNPSRAPGRQPPPPPLTAVREVEVAEIGVHPGLGPYLERRSSGEVSLVTTARSMKPKQLEAIIPKPKNPAHAVLIPAERPNAPLPQPLLATAVRWVPLRFASAPQNVMLLNAARSQGLAARTRNLLAGRGWRSIGIGDARQQRERSLVLYPAARAVTARRLAGQFGCKAIKSASVKGIVVLLGREAASRRSSRA